MAGVLRVNSEPANKAEAVTKGTDFPECRALYFGTGGTASVVVSGATSTFLNVPDGSILPVKCTQVVNSGDVANIIALY